MAVTLGTSRRCEGRGWAAAGKDGAADVDARDVFRRHFEAKFLPLAKEELGGLSGDDESEAEAEVDVCEEEEWEGFESEDGAVMVVEHSAIAGDSAPMLDKLELKAFMVRPSSDSSIRLLGAHQFDSRPSLLRRSRQIGPNPRPVIH